MIRTLTIKAYHYSGRIGDRRMKRIFTKAVTALLAFSMLMSVASCSSKKKSGSGSRSGKKISEDTAWYDSQVYDLDQGLDKEREVEYAFSSFVGSDEDNIILLTYGNYKIPDNIDWTTYNYSDYEISVLSIIDRATKKTIKNIDMSDMLGSEDYVDNARYTNGKVTVIYSSYNEQTWEMTFKEMDIDPKSGNVLETRDSENEGVYQRSFRVGDYTVDSEGVWNSEITSFNLIIYGPDGSKTKVEIKDDRKSVYEVSAVIPLEESKALVIAYTDSGNKYYELDLKTGKLTETDSKEYEWLDLNVLFSTFNGTDGYVYYTTPAGISKIDVKKKTDEEIFNYSWCGINRNTLTNLQIAEISEDSFLLCGGIYKMNPFTQMSDYNDTDFTLIEFNKAAKNPNAGKTIIEMYSSYGYTDDSIADAVLKFNETNADYFIEVADRYRNAFTFDYDEMNSDDDMETQSLNYNAALSNKLAMDIINGEGPDILMDVSSFGQLNNKDCLADLTPYIGSLDPDKYFTNILDAAKVDGKLYNLPVSFRIEGIQTDPKYAGSSGVGFTTDEYVKFLKETLNGKDVISYGQAMYFAKLFNNMSDKYIVNGKADFSDPSLTALAEYVKDNVQEKSVSWDEEDMDGSGYSSLAIYGYTASDNGLAMYTNCSSYFDFFRGLEELNGSSAILGLPSADGHGPSAGHYNSVAVSAQAVNVDACGEFIKLLMSDSVQEDLAVKGGYLVLNREAFRKAGEMAIGYYNEQGGVMIDRYDQYGNRIPPRNQLKFNEGQLDDLENIISACTAMDSEDAAINLILVEEMQPYFAGQKSLDDVLKIAQDRVQKVLDERG